MDFVHFILIPFWGKKTSIINYVNISIINLYFCQCTTIYILYDYMCRTNTLTNQTNNISLLRLLDIYFHALKPLIFNGTYTQSILSIVCWLYHQIVPIIKHIKKIIVLVNDISFGWNLYKYIFTQKEDSNNTLALGRGSIWHVLW